MTIDYRGIWEAKQTPDPDDIPFFAIEYDDVQILVSRFRWNDRKKYKTLKGAAKYIIGELKDSCDRRQKQKDEDDAKREHEQKSVQLLQDFQGILTSNGIESRLCLVAERYHYNHLCIDTTRVNARIDITVTNDYRLEFAFSYPRFYTSPETALDILSVFSKRETA